MNRSPFPKIEEDELEELHRTALFGGVNISEDDQIKAFIAGMHGTIFGYVVSSGILSNAEAERVYKIACEETFNQFKDYLRRKVN